MVVKAPGFSDNAPKHRRFFPRLSIAARLLFAASVFFALCTCIVVWLSLSTQRAAFYNYANEICLTSNAMAAYAIDGDEMEKIASTLTVNDDYRRFATKLDALFNTIEAKYLYVLTDTGVPGMYTYIYDATHMQEFPGEQYALGRLETKDEYKGADKVLNEGAAFKSAVYYNNAYGELYYAYAPIFNSKGKAVAFVGTDIDIAPLNHMMDDFVLLVGLGFAFSCLAFILGYYFMVLRIYTRPTRILIESAARLSRGDLELHIPEAMLRREDEIGQLALAFTQANSGVTRLSSEAEDTLAAVHDGSMSRRADGQGLEGAFGRVIQGLNNTMESICRHFDDMPCAVAFYSASGEMLFANRAVRQFAQALGMESPLVFLESLLSEGDGPSLLSALPASGEATLGRTRFMRGQGTERVYSLNLLRAADASGICGLNIMLVAADITDLALARHAAEEATRAKSEFLARMSHEIRTPMNAVLGLAYLALRDDPPPAQRERLQKIQTAASSLLDIINEILDFSKIEARKMELNRSPFALRSEVCSICDMIRQRAAEKGIEICIWIAPDVPDYLCGDSGRLRQILVNLLGNAVKFTSKGGILLEMAVEKQDADQVEMLFSVYDTGIGIDDEAMQRLFAPFTQADSSITRRFGGTGLGLVISRELAQLMGGCLEAHSYPGSGSVFTLVLPFDLCEEVLPAKAAESEYSSILAGRRVLLVEDNEINQLIGRDILEQVNMVVSTADNGLEALQALSKEAFDLVLMDIQMPVMDGLEAARRIRQMPAPVGTVPIVAMTAHAMEQDREKSLAAGMNDHTTKPIEPDKLYAVLARLLS